jgi:hypothetical protein
MEPGMVMHSCNHSTQEAEAGYQEYEARLGCIGTHCLKEEKKKPTLL